ncbi:MAG: HAD hydrolase family protein [Cyclobacteriaceae bacterium]
MKELKDIRLFVYDFDGVMTDNKVIVDENGKESVSCNRSDGLAIQLIKEMDIAQLIMSTEKNQVVKKRAEKLGLEVLNNVSDKKSCLQEYSKKHSIDIQTVLFIGNDLNDKAVMKACGYSVCPADAAPEIKEIATLVTTCKGGEGVIRELYTKLNNEYS